MQSISKSSPGIFYSQSNRTSATGIIWCNSYNWSYWICHVAVLACFTFGVPNSLLPAMYRKFFILYWEFFRFTLWTLPYLKILSRVLSHESMISLISPYDDEIIQEFRKKLRNMFSISRVWVQISSPLYVTVVMSVSDSSSSQSSMYLSTVKKLFVFALNHNYIPN